MAPMLHHGLTERGVPVVCIESRQPLRRCALIVSAARCQADMGRQPSSSACVEGFGWRPLEGRRRLCSAAGVRKPPKETALGGRRTMPPDRAKSRQTTFRRSI